MALPGKVEWFRVLPFFLLHAAAITAWFVQPSWFALGIGLFFYFARVFGLTGFYHRYFSHRAFKTSRAVQFLGGLLGSSAGQRGPIWWAAHHRHHHRASDRPDDIHSPKQQGFWWSHMLWFMTRENYATDERKVKDWMQYPELRFLDRFDFLAPALLAALLFGVGAIADYAWPQLQTTGVTMLVWAYLIPTLALYHVTFAINSLAHTFGSRRFATRDDSRNNLWLALVTFGEGWHNNHHHYPASARQGFYWWEIDITYYLLLAMSCLGLVWELKPVPEHVLEHAGSDHRAGSQPLKGWS